MRREKKGKNRIKRAKTLCLRILWRLQNEETQHQVCRVSVIFINSLSDRSSACKFVCYLTTLRPRLI